MYSSPLFTARHYEWIAKFISNDPLPEKDRVQLAYRLANRMRQDNPRFNSAKFVKACILKEE